ncbi:putative Cytochrome P450 [Melia azedarach]|uniref:Cytochrome P450 n=1 Tax=Melia azedarach TaxID=155640 RepID=A0ACC1XM25_MELAZ|nr:putative Cytochrome P450 [Melia azedarach]
MSFLLQLLSTIAAAMFIIFLLFKWLCQPSKKQHYSPPSPPKLPIIGNLHQLGLLPHRSLHALAKRYGPLMLLHFGKVPVLVVSSADAARLIMRSHDSIFANRPKTTPAQKLLYDGKDVALSPEQNEYWRQIKSICVLHLLSNKRVRSFHNIREEETALMIQKIKRLSSSSLPINLSEALCTLTNDIVCRVSVGRKYSEEEAGRKFMELLEKIEKLLATFHVGDYVPWLAWVCRFNGLDAVLEKVAKEVDEFLERVVEEHEKRMIMKNNKGTDQTAASESEDQKNIMHALLWIQKSNMYGKSIDRVSIKAIILNMFGAGTDTTYTALEWAMTELLRHPDIMKRTQNEVRGIVGDKSDITEEDLDKMHYLKAVIKETLRFHPPVPLLLPRQSTQDVKIKGYDIPAGTQVIINYWTIGRDPALWGQPEEFRPERFMNSSIDFHRSDFQFIPFGAGRRGCPGIQFGMRVAELALANLLKKFDWSLAAGESGEDLDMTESTSVTVHKKSPLVAMATPY